MGFDIFLQFFFSNKKRLVIVGHWKFNSKNLSKKLNYKPAEYIFAQSIQSRAYKFTHTHTHTHTHTQKIVAIVVNMVWIDSENLSYIPPYIYIHQHNHNNRNECNNKVFLL